MEQQKPAQKTITQAENQKYQAMKNEFSVLFKNVLNLKEEKKENMQTGFYASLVLETLEKLDGKRKCWRSIGGVLVERTAEEIITALKHRNDKELAEKIKNYEEKMDAKQKELLELERALGIQGQPSKESHMEDKRDGPQTGVLV